MCSKKLSCQPGSQEETEGLLTCSNGVEENKSENTEGQSGMGAPTPVTMRKQQMVPPRNQGCH